MCWQMGEVVICWWLLKSNLWSNGHRYFRVFTQLIVVIDLGLGDQISNVLAKLRRIWACLIGFVLSFAGTICESCECSVRFPSV